jgi:hypothetical protein
MLIYQLWLFYLFCYDLLHHKDLKKLEYLENLICSKCFSTGIDSATLLLHIFFLIQNRLSIIVLKGFTQLMYQSCTILFWLVACGLQFYKCCWYILKGNSSSISLFVAGIVLVLFLQNPTFHSNHQLIFFCALTISCYINNCSFFVSINILWYMFKIPFWKFTFKKPRISCKVTSCIISNLSPIYYCFCLVNVKRRTKTHKDTD